MSLKILAYSKATDEHRRKVVNQPLGVRNLVT